METKNKTSITVENTVKAPARKSMAILDRTGTYHANGPMRRTHGIHPLLKTT